MAQKPIKHVNKVEKISKYRKINNKKDHKTKITKMINKNIFEHIESLHTQAESKKNMGPRKKRRNKTQTK